MWHFDARGFGRALRERRAELGYSTRSLALAAGVSQSYVVALEGSRSSRDVAGPRPTIDLVVRLASALRVEPTALLAPFMHRSGPHVLVVVEDDGAGLFEAATALADGVDTWVSAGHRRSPAGPARHIELHGDQAATYDAEAVDAALRGGLAALGPAVNGERVGIVFSESPSVLLDDTEAVLHAEHRWSAMVGDAVCAAGGRPAWNLCVYELDVLRRMADPFAASLDLIRSHDTVWTTNGTAVRRHRAASMRLLQHFRPEHTRADHWRQVCRKQLDRIAAN